jgi:hypothetical protein
MRHGPLAGGCEATRAAGGAAEADTLASQAERVSRHRPDTLGRGVDAGQEARWAVPGSNQRPPACKAGALPTELTALARGECPQRDSNPRYGLERAVTWAASRWGRPSQDTAA